MDVLPPVAVEKSEVQLPRTLAVGRAVPTSQTGELEPEGTEGTEKPEADRQRLLILADSPTIQSGFGRVVAAMLPFWADFFDQIDIWGINYDGRPHKLPCRIYPVWTTSGQHWSAQSNLQYLLNHIVTRQSKEGWNYTHIWILQDTFLLAQHNFPAALRKACETTGAKSYLYFPADAPLERSWCKIIEEADVAVAYTDYGRREAQRKVGELTIAVLPHGVDQRAFHVVTQLVENSGGKDLTQRRKDAKITKETEGVEAVRAALRRSLFSREWLKPNDILMVNVNMHQRRKDVTRGLEILAGLHAAGHTEFKLLMHMESVHEGLDLEVVGKQLGLTRGVEWEHTGEMFRGSYGTLSEEDLRRIYNAADLYLTTTLGEGWGLGMTEALACGCPVAAPAHTACLELNLKLIEKGMPRQMVMLPLEPGAVVLPNDNSRLRPRVSLPGAVGQLVQWSVGPRARLPLNEAVSEWLNWERIAGEWLRLFGV